ncbi:unnamed protein product [Mytilus edulis]|uniref:Uncharacterized protein n=1 Tax=Mytilus edulis TaxID=6550 RepID=A0A8S3TV52_MYTED|nr:unnamed protein product [Mytilus edulis]
MQKDFDSVTEAGDIINSENVVHRQTSTPRLDEASANVSVRPKLPSSTNIVSELDKTIQELTIQNKILERDLLAKQHELLVAKKTSGGESSRTKTKDNDKVGKRAKELTRQLINQSSSSSDDSDSTSSNDNDEDKDKTQIKGNDLPYVIFKDRQKRTAVSGEARAAKDRVKYDVPWPHEHAQTKSVNYSDKDFGLAQLVRGETFIMHNIEKQAISVLRQKHLINLLYLVEKYPFTEIKDFHAEVLRSIERGHKNWSHAFVEEQGRTLPHPLFTWYSSTLTKTVFKDKVNCNPICGANCSRSRDNFGAYIAMATKSCCMFAESVSVKEKIREIRLCYILRRIVRIINDVQLQCYIVILLK